MIEKVDQFLLDRYSKASWVAVPRQIAEQSRLYGIDRYMVTVYAWMVFITALRSYPILTSEITFSPTNSALIGETTYAFALLPGLVLSFLYRRWAPTFIIVGAVYAELYFILGTQTDTPVFLNPEDATWELVGRILGFVFTSGGSVFCVFYFLYSDRVKTFFLLKMPDGANQLIKATKTGGASDHGWHGYGTFPLTMIVALTLFNLGMLILFIGHGGFDWPGNSRFYALIFIVINIALLIKNKAGIFITIIALLFLLLHDFFYSIQAALHQQIEWTALVIRILDGYWGTLFSISCLLLAVFSSREFLATYLRFSR